MDAYRNRVLLIVNVASQCGFTPQYAGLEALYRKHRDDGLVVLGYPCDQFGHQEPGAGAKRRSRRSARRNFRSHFRCSRRSRSTARRRYRSIDT